MTLRIATRGSAQAMTQSQAVADGLRALGVDTELIAVSTLGDRTQRSNTPLHAIGGQGVFVKEIQQAVLDGHADLAVHSAKDLPSTPSPGLTIAAFTRRRSAADALVGRRLDDLAHGATVATGSVRRRAQLHLARPDLVFAELRGNIHSRLDKIPVDGSIVMALAALEVLGITEHVAEVLDPTTFVPAVGQGCVAVECADSAATTIELVAGLDHAPTRQAVTIERAYLAELGSGCSLPVAAHSDGAALRVFLAADDASRAFSETLELSGDLLADMASARRLAGEANAVVRQR